MGASVAGEEPAARLCPVERCSGQGWAAGGPGRQAWAQAGLRPPLPTWGPAGLLGVLRPALGAAGSGGPAGVPGNLQSRGCRSGAGGRAGVVLGFPGRGTHPMSKRPLPAPSPGKGARGLPLTVSRGPLQWPLLVGWRRPF